MVRLRYKTNNKIKKNKKNELTPPFSKHARKLVCPLHTKKYRNMFDFIFYSVSLLLLSYLLQIQVRLKNTLGLGLAAVWF